MVRLMLVVVGLLVFFSSNEVFSQEELQVPQCVAMMLKKEYFSTLKRTDDILYENLTKLGCEPQEKVWADEVRYTVWMYARYPQCSERQLRLDTRAKALAEGGVGNMLSIQFQAAQRLLNERKVLPCR